MSGRMLIFFLVLLALAPLADAKNKKKQALPDYVIKAQTVLVVIHPDAGEPLTNPTANRTAQDDVEKALMKWGRFKLVMDAQTADWSLRFGRDMRVVQRPGIRQRISLAGGLPAEWWRHSGRWPTRSPA